MKTKTTYSTLFNLIAMVMALFLMSWSCNDEHSAKWLIYPDDARVAVATRHDEFSAQSGDEFSSFKFRYFTEIKGGTADDENPGFQKSLITTIEDEYNDGDYDKSTSHPDGIGFISTGYENWRSLDMRLANGWNNWGTALSMGDAYMPGRIIESWLLIREDSDDTYYRSTYQVTKDDITSPPAYLHLVVSSVFDFQSRNFLFSNTKPLEKRWVVQSIADVNGVDVTSSPDWECFADNVYTFRKNGSVRYEPGAKACEIDAELKNLGLERIFQSFTIEPDVVDFNNPGRILMTFQAPPANELGLEDYVIEIMSSDFDEATFRVTNGNGDQADLKIIPEE